MTENEREEKKTRKNTATSGNKILHTAVTFVAHEREGRVSAMFRGGRAKYTESPLEMGHAGDTSH